MSELSEPLWAVISERGCEASRVTYDEAHRLVEKLGHEGVYGRCIVTSLAAARMLNDGDRIAAGGDLPESKKDEAP
jgi:hypothetical protein